jgi:transposase
MKHRVDGKKQLVTIIVDTAGDGGIIDILPDRTSETIKRRLLDAPNRSEVRNVTMDFTGPFRDIITGPIIVSGTRLPRQGNGKRARKLQPELFNAEEVIQLEELKAATQDGHPPLLENAKIVGDHFHFAQALEDSFDDVRIAVQKGMFKHFMAIEMAKYTAEELCTLGTEDSHAHAKAKAKEMATLEKSELFKRRRTFNLHPKKLVEEDDLKVVLHFVEEFPLLRAGYELKNAGLDILSRHKSPEQTEVSLDSWQAMAKKSMARKFFTPVINFIRNWRSEIIGYAEHNLSNARTESKVGLLKMRNRSGRGISFEVIRAIMIWSSAHRRNYRWPKCCDNGKPITARRLITYLDSEPMRG